MSENNRVRLSVDLIDRLREDLEAQINSVEDFIDTLPETSYEEREAAEVQSKALSACCDFLDTFLEAPDCLCDLVSVPGAFDAFIKLITPYCKFDMSGIDPDDIPPAAEVLA